MTFQLGIKLKILNKGVVSTKISGNYINDPNKPGSNFIALLCFTGRFKKL